MCVKEREVCKSDKNTMVDSSGAPASDDDNGSSSSSSKVAGGGDGSGNNSTTTLSVAKPTTLATTSVPPGIQVRWSQRKEKLWINVEAPDIQDAEVTMEDSGLIHIKAKEAFHSCTLQLLHRIHVAESRWVESGRSVRLELAKAETGRPYWDKLVVAERRLANIVPDWGSWIDEAEEIEARNNPYGHDTNHMAAAMGALWGSNVDRAAKAREQAQKVNTSSGDGGEEEEDEITMV